jgi:hypothetical protein
MRNGLPERNFSNKTDGVFLVLTTAGFSSFLRFLSLSTLQFLHALDPWYRSKPPQPLHATSLVNVYARFAIFLLSSSQL